MGEVGVNVDQSYVERSAPPALAGLVASVWIQRVGGGPHVQRDVPSGSVELRCRVGGPPEIVGPLTRARVETLDSGTTVVGVRLHPAAAARLLSRPASEVVDEVVRAEEVWGDRALRLGEDLAAASTGADAARHLLDHLLGHVRASPTGPGADTLAARAVQELRWHTDDVGAVARELHVSERHLRRRVLAEVGLSPKTLHRALRFQRFLALAQHTMAQGKPPGDDGLGRRAADVGYADQAHLSRECVRLTGLTPGAFLRDAEENCACGHDHAAAYAPLLRARHRGARPGRGNGRSVQGRSGGGS